MSGAANAVAHETIPTGEYEVLLADPPWRYEHCRSDSRRIENHYPTLSLDELKGIDVPAAADAILYLWATAPLTAKAIELLESWGFEYRTNVVWDKRAKGMGYWARINHELILIGRRGEFSPPEPGRRPDSVIRAERQGHSEKPPDVYRLIETAYPEKEKLELFARDGRVGWEAWGNEVPQSKQNTLPGLGGEP